MSEGARHCWWLEGNAAWARGEAARLASGRDEVLWLGDAEQAPPGLSVTPMAKARRLLGGECALLIFDAFAGFDADAFGAAVGTLRRGGTLLLLSPPEAEWPDYPDPQHERLAVYPREASEVSGRFLRRLARTLASDVAVHRFAKGDALPTPAPASPLQHAHEWATEEQHATVEAIERLAHGHRHRPLVLSSDRGRGKSTALGIAAAHLLRSGVESIIVTAPRATAVASLLEHARRLWPERNPCFVPPDELTLQPRGCNLLMVDEAAAIPVGLLQRMLEHYPRIVFATTVHGYEGTGRGFALRFRKHLDERCPGWRGLELKQPIRWDEMDPLEHLVNRALLLQAAPAEDETLTDATAEACDYQHLDRDALADDETSLSELFALLVLAHYRTRPTDLRQLLDGPNLSVRVLRYRGRIAACLLSAREGGFDEALAGAIYRGERRPRGHLLPQSLAVHAGFIEAPQLRGERVIRIAVHPVLQGRGLGRRLVRQLETEARAEGLDFVGAAFGGEPGLLAFWRRLDWQLLRVGLSRETGSGAHPLLMLSPQSPAAESLATEAASRLRYALPLQLGDPLRQMEPAMAAALTAALHDDTAPAPEPGLDGRDWADLESFVHGHRDYGNVLGAIWKLLHLCEVQDDQARALLEAKVFQHRDWSEVVASFKLQGRRQAQQALRTALQPLLSSQGARSSMGGSAEMNQAGDVDGQEN